MKTSSFALSLRRALRLLRPGWVYSNPQAALFVKESDPFEAADGLWFGPQMPEWCVGFFEKRDYTVLQHRSRRDVEEFAAATPEETARALVVYIESQRDAFEHTMDCVRLAHGERIDEERFARRLATLRKEAGRGRAAREKGKCVE